MLHPRLRSLPLWLPAYLRRKRPPAPAAPADILLCVCDHFEPLHAGDAGDARRRLAEWHARLPGLAADFRDADGRPPRPSFFYPAEQYRPDLMEEVARLQQAGLGEIEIHLHHDGDNAATLRRRLDEAVRRFAQHGLLCRDPAGRRRFAFIHGNWALDNSDPAGRHCGVNTELDELRQAGCYADFTMPAAPHPAQTRIINALYYAHDTPAPKSHDRGIPAAVRPGGRPENALLLVQGPLALNWRQRKYGLLPRIENGALTGNHPPAPGRMRLWLDMHIHVQGRPEWIFIKLHTHGCNEQHGNPEMLLGEPMRRFHRHLAERYNDGHRYRLHYLTAREMVNILHAAEDGRTGDPGAYRDYLYTIDQ